jgi:hypothetical protein
MPDVRRCAQEGCRAFALRGDDKCFFHSERTQEAHGAAVRKGGQNSRRKFRTPTNIEDCRELLAETVIGMMRGKIPSRRGQPIVTALKAILHTFELQELRRTNDLIEGRNHAEQSQ